MEGTANVLLSMQEAKVIIMKINIFNSGYCHFLF